MPVTSGSFNILNGSQQFNQQLDTSLNYLSQQSSIAAQMQQVVDQATQAGKSVMVIDSTAADATKWIPQSEVGQDAFGHMPDGTPVLILNLNAACLVWETDPQTGKSTVTGVQSAADGLYHELVGHGLNSNNDAESHQTDSQYQYVNERVAVNAESLANALLGEPDRNNHYGVDIPINNPTLHTITTEDGALQLTWMGADGKPQYGPQIAIGTPIWNDLQKFGKQVQDNINNANHQHDSSGGGGSVDTTGHNSDPGTIIIYDEQGNPTPFHNPPVPDPNDPGTPIVELPDGPEGTGGANDPNADPYYDPNGNPWTDVGGQGGATGGPYGGEEGGSDDSPGAGGGYDGVGDLPGWGGDWGGGGGSSDFGCVVLASHLPDGRTAGEVVVGDTMQLGDEETMEPATGVVSYAETKKAACFRITTESGASLVCSNSAPIPTKHSGLLNPVKLLGELVAVRWDEAGTSSCHWEKVINIEPMGDMQVRHITVGNKCFWAGEKKGAYILHHNIKQAGGGSGGGGGDDDPFGWFFDPLKANPNNNDALLAHVMQQTGVADGQPVPLPHPIDPGPITEPAPVVGVPQPISDPLAGFM